MPQLRLFGRADKSADTQIAKKVNGEQKKSTVSVKAGNDILSAITQTQAVVSQKLGAYRDRYALIQTEESLVKYIDSCVKNGIVSIDTETDGLNPMLNKIAGVCIYTPNEKPSYIPINHISYITEDKLANQINADFVAEQMKRLQGLEIIMFNAKFDMRVIKNQLGVKLNCTWDCYLASRLMNENEPQKGLKALHKKYCEKDDSQEAFSFESLFSNIPFTKIPPQVGYLYAANDAIITYELYLFQKPYLTAEDKVCIEHELTDVAWVFHNIEMPCVEVCCSMEDNGIEIDLEKSKLLSNEYTKILQDKKDAVYSICEQYKALIDKYRSANINNKLSEPINIDSPTQLAILIYDILGVEPVDKKKPRGTGEEVLTKIDIPLCKAILEYRGVAKLINTYIDKLPKCVNPNDNRIHCNFNQYGADTGRFSSSEPNLQNIPSHNKDIRQVFKATDDYVLMSSDYSQQEPKCLASMCAKAGDRRMLETFLSGKDLYSEIASVSFNYPYEQCLEFNPDGTTNKEGKERRTQAKSILLGSLYGRSVPSIAEQLHCSVEKAERIKQSVFKGFPAIKQFESTTLDFAYDYGFVTTICGRKRRLPDYQLDEYEFKWAEDCNSGDDLLDFDSVESEVPTYIVNKYLSKLHNAKFGQKRSIFEQANREGIYVIDNTRKIAEAERQCVNARIQGSASDLTKLAMISLYNNEELRELGFRMLIPIHDEILAECPKKNYLRCKQLLADIMCDTAEKILGMPIKCDVTVTENWYGEEFGDGV